jgi:hypothetical protein
MRTSKYFVETLDPLSVVDMEKLATIRKTVSMLNSITDTKQYVKLHGRGSRIEATWKSGNPSNYNRYCRELPLRFAERIDVYIYNRR